MIFDCRFVGDSGLVIVDCEAVSNRQSARNDQQRINYQPSKNQQ